MDMKEYADTHHMAGLNILVNVFLKEPSLEIFRIFIHHIMGPNSVGSQLLVS
jgi:hypothetical protein